jgi:plastocyanin
MRLLTITAALLLLILALGVSACGDDDDDDSTGDDGDATATATADTGDDGGDEPTFVEIDAADFSFDPTDVIVAGGIDLTFVLSNTGSAPHTLDIYSDEEFTEAVDGASTGNVPGGTVGEFTVTLEPGDYFYRCELHPGQMTGTLAAQ